MSIFWRRSGMAGWCWAVVCLSATAAATGPIQDLTQIAETAAATAENLALQRGYDNVSVNTQDLDPRVRLPRCGEAPGAFIPPGSRVPGALSVGVSCAGPSPWTIYVRAEVRAQRAVPVLTRPLARYTVISPDDIRVIDQPLEAVPNGIVFDPERIIGMELVRSLEEGSPLQLKHLRPPKVISRGQQVTLVAGQAGLEVRTQGKALGDAAAGERVRVNAAASGRLVEGTARADGTVYVP